jgi:MscS family membrane protein
MGTNVTRQLAFGPAGLPWLQWEILGNQIWQYLIFLGYVLAAVFISKLMDLLLRRALKTSGQIVKSRDAERLLGLLRTPLKLAVFIFLLHVGVRPMNKPVWLQGYLDHGFGMLIAVSVTYAAIRTVDFGFELTREHLRRHARRTQDPILLLLERAARIFVIGVAILVTADNNGIKVGGVLASLGLTGLAVALAAQETLSNFLGSIVILADSPFFVGDRVKIDAFEGTVEHIGIRSTRLQTTDGNIVTIPNRTVAGTSVTNYSQTAHQLTSQQESAQRPVTATDSGKQGRSG